jgi:predicted DCC family thiol-disulfide oxidoreductase YuxK
MNGPVILFDGVCNLCHAAVAWERDKGLVFRFASLQSAAARDVLTAAGQTAELPDSVVLVDEQGVHTRSAAAIRVARRLGFPWSLAVLASPLPGFFRDAAYAWVARNRYRWFGRRDSCLAPSPEWAGRFLDADEVIAVPAAAEPVARGLNFFELLLYSYLFVYIFPFPLSGVPGAGSVTDPYDALWQKVIQWFATNILQVNASTLPGGSGDTTYNYVETLVDALLAIVMATGAWWWLRSKADLVREGIRVYVRYSLGAIMLSYGWHKLFPLQMMEPGPDRLVMPMADKSPMGILWAFIGLSPAYQMLCGFVEVLGGALLLFRRTTLLGALVSAGAMAQVVALNFCYDVPVKLFSSHLLLSALFLLAPHLPGLLSFLVGLPAQPVAVRPWLPARPWLRGLAKGALIGLFAIFPVYSSYRALAQRHGRDLGPLHGYYNILSFQGPADLQPERRWVRVGFNGGYNGAGILRADGEVKRHSYSLAKETVTLTTGKDQKVPLRYRNLGPDTISLEGDYEGAKLTVILKRVPPLLTTRGFHWVNERPFHR